MPKNEENTIARGHGATGRYQWPVFYHPTVKTGVNTRLSGQSDRTGYSSIYGRQNGGRPAGRGEWGIVAGLSRCVFVMAGKDENRSPINAITRKQGNTRHRVRLDAPSGVWRRLCDGGASPTLRTARRSAIYDRHQKNVEHQCPTYNFPLNRPSPRGGGLGWGLPAYRRCPVAIPVSFQNFRVRVGYAATHPTHEIRHRVRLGAPSGAWRRLCDGGASPTLRTARRSAIYDRHQKNVGHECPTYNFPLNRPSPRGGGLGWGLPAYRRCPVAIPVKKTNFGAPSGAWRRFYDGGANPTLRTARRSAIYGRQQKKRRA